MCRRHCCCCTVASLAAAAVWAAEMQQLARRLDNVETTDLAVGICIQHVEQPGAGTQGHEHRDEEGNGHQEAHGDDERGERDGGADERHLRGVCGGACGGGGHIRV
jgi:hypothetical protein